MVKLAVAGAAGRMGGRVISLAAENPQLEVAAAFEAPGHPMVGKPISEVARCAGDWGLVGDDAAAAIAAADVMVSFTAPQASVEHASAAAAAGKPAVVGTTGLDEEQEAALAQAAQKIALVFTPNMSVAMNLMFKLADLMTRVLGEDYCLELLEAHHDQKKDAPSGTAVRLLETVSAVRGWDPKEVLAHGRVGMVGARPKDEIGVGVIRGGDIVGEHTLYFIGQGERLELTHRAHSRDTFVRGALRAALWAVDQKPGLYDMSHVLGLGEL